MMELIAVVIVKVETIEIQTRLNKLPLTVIIKHDIADTISCSGCPPTALLAEVTKKTGCLYVPPFLLFFIYFPHFPSSFMGEVLLRKAVLCIFSGHPCVSPHPDPFVKDFCAHRTAVESSFSWLHESAFVHGEGNSISHRK